MAKARVVVSDVSSEEVDELRRCVHSLLHMMETAAASITATATAEQVLSVWSAAIASGVDNNPNAVANVVSSGREIVGVYPSRKLPPRRRSTKLVTLEASDKSI